ncbi:MAG: glycyl-radical enzyme activating protein [Candidatus Hodarchaeota archaeon]
MKSIKGIIFDIKKYALHDGPGIRSTVFFKGCPLKCWWCHNPEGINPEPEPFLKNPGNFNSLNSKDTIVGREVTVDDVIDKIRKDWIFYEQSNGGVTISGGEPLMQPKFLLSLLQKCHQVLDSATTLDTSGYASWKTIESILEYVDLFLYDIKIFDDKNHKKYTGVSNNQIILNAEALDKQANNIIIRFPVIPGITDTSTNIEQICIWLQERSKIDEIHLLPYHEIAKVKYERLRLKYCLGDLKPPSDDHMKKIYDIFKSIGFKVKIGG